MRTENVKRNPPNSGDIVAEGQRNERCAGAIRRPEAIPTYFEVERLHLGTACVAGNPIWHNVPLIT